MQTKGGGIMKLFTSRLLNGISNEEIISIVNLQNKWRKFLSILALIGVLGTYLPFNLFKISANSEPNRLEIVSKEQYDSTTDSSFDPYAVKIVSEEITKRELSSKVFKKIDGTYEVAIYDNVIHFNNHGELEDIDNRLIFDEETKSLVNKNNDIKVYFPQYLENSQHIMLLKDKYQVNWTILNVENSEVSYVNSSIKSDNIKELPYINQALLYKSIQKNVDIEYVLSGDDVKENIIINEYIPNYSISFIYELNGLQLTNIDGNYVFINENDDTIFEFDDLFMIDAENNISDNVKLQVGEVSPNTYKVTLLPEDDWLKSANYPIQIDPTITSGNNNITIEDTYISQQYPTLNYSGALTMPLAAPGALELRGLLRFNLPSILVNNIVTYSYLTLTKCIGTTDKQINLYKNDENYNNNTVIWNNRPDFDPQIIDYHIIREDSQYRFDITSVVKNWNETGTSNTPGFTIRDTDYSFGSNVVYISSTEHDSNPTLEIGYLEPGGVRDYWTYNSQSAGAAGTGYVCDFTGKLYFTRSDFNFSTSIQSLGLTFIYSNENRYVNLGYGNGWQTNYHIRVYPDISINESTFYTIDGSGQKTHFIHTDTPNQFIAEDGSGNVLTEETLGYIIKTRDNIEYYFDVNGYLYEIADLSKNREGVSENLSSIKIVRLSDKNKIDYIYDNSDNKIVFTYNSNMLDYTTLMIKQDDDSFYTLERVNYSYTTYVADAIRYELNTVTNYKHYDD